MAIGLINDSTKSPFATSSGIPKSIGELLVLNLKKKAHKGDSNYIECNNTGNANPTIIMWGDCDSMKNQLAINLNKLERFSTYTENWNGYGSAPFSSTMIAYAKRVLHALDYQPEIFPVAGGAIQMQYEKASGEYLEFVIELDMSISIFSIDKDGNELEKILPQDNFDANLVEINLMVKRIYE